MPLAGSDRRTGKPRKGDGVDRSRLDGGQITGGRGLKSPKLIKKANAPYQRIMGFRMDQIANPVKVKLVVPFSAYLRLAEQPPEQVVVIVVGFSTLRFQGAQVSLVAESEFDLLWRCRAIHARSPKDSQLPLVGFCHPRHNLAILEPGPDNAHLHHSI